MQPIATGDNEDGSIHQTTERVTRLALPTETIVDVLRIWSDSGRYQELAKLTFCKWLF
jgi:hypothetical protein